MQHKHEAFFYIIVDNVRKRTVLAHYTIFFFFLPSYRKGGDQIEVEKRDCSLFCV